MTMSTTQPEYDIIFAGGKAVSNFVPLPLNLLPGGATACIVAGRLAAANSTLKILVGTTGAIDESVVVTILLSLRSLKMDQAQGTSLSTFSQQDFSEMLWTRLPKLFNIIEGIQVMRLAGGHL